MVDLWSARHSVRLLRRMRRRLKIARGLCTAAVLFSRADLCLTRNARRLNYSSL